jgi:cytochrome c5
MLGKPGDEALEALWILNLRGELGAVELCRHLRHPNPHVRRWSVRLLGDQNTVAAVGQAALVTMAKLEPDAEVRSQLASSARRLPAGQAFPILRQLFTREEDADDLHIPLLIWWAIESKLDTGREELIALAGDPSVWQSTVFSTHIVPRIGRRYAADQGLNRHYTLKEGAYSAWYIDRSTPHLRRNLESCDRLLRVAPTPADADLLLAGMAEGLAGPPVDAVPKSLQARVEEIWRSRPHSPGLISLAGRLGIGAALPEAATVVRSGKQEAGERERLLELLISSGSAESLALLSDLLRQEQNQQHLGRLMEMLNAFADPAPAGVLIDLYPRLGPRLRNAAQRMLSARADWATVMLQRMNEGSFDPGVLNSANVATMRVHQNPRLDALLAAHEQRWSDEPGRRAAQQFFEYGKTVYALNCSPCHQPNGQGLVQLAPPLVGSPWVQQGGEAVIRILLHGKQGQARGLLMPAFPPLDNRQGRRPVLGAAT